MHIKKSKSRVKVYKAICVLSREKMFEVLYFHYYMCIYIKSMTKSVKFLLEKNENKHCITFYSGNV